MSQVMGEIIRADKASVWNWPERCKLITNLPYLGGRGETEFDTCSGRPTKIAGDFNADGKADILWQNNDGTPAVWLMDGTSLISGANVGSSVGSNWQAIPQHQDLFV